jgi:cysteine desulfuration protein SufE
MLVEELASADRQDRIELLIDLAKSLPGLPPHLEDRKDEASRVPECMSPVFLFVEPQAERLRVYADAPIEAPTVRGFVAMLVEGLDGESLEAVAGVPADLVQRAGMVEILGMQRVQGLSGVLRQLKKKAVLAVADAAGPRS